MREGGGYGRPFFLPSSQRSGKIRGRRIASKGSREVSEGSSEGGIPRF